MNGVRVNLLPREAEDRERERRLRGGLIAGGVGLLLILAGLYALQLWRVGQAEEELRLAEERRAELQQELNRLQEFEALQQRRDEAVGVVETAMSHEASFAGILQDVAAVMPNDAALSELSVNVAAEPQPEADFAVGGPAWGTITGSGETVGGHAPGVERFIVQFDKIAAFFDVHVSSSTVDEEGFATFSFESHLGPEIFTGRYLDGLPERLR
jgi:hypothetical protein